MKSIWVVEEDSYSDYRVVGVFSTKENAQRVSDLVKYSSIAEWPVDPGIEEMNQGRRPYNVRMMKDGTVNSVLESRWDYAFEMDATPSVGFPLSCPKGILSGTVFATDETHAIKIMNEHRAQFIAEGKWPE